MNEFSLIRHYFTRPTKRAVLGPGDDCALLRPSPGHDFAVSADMLLVDRHFFADAEPFSLGHKALAVNLSDLAAMGAQPRYALLSIALPEANENWLAAFSRGLFALADRYEVELVGGDTTRGPLTLSLQVIGEVPSGQGLRRHGAQVGDSIWVSGRLGDAALALAHQQQKTHLVSEQLISCNQALHTPEPRIALGLALRNLATSTIDISDGLLGDLGHILDASAVGAEIELARIPKSKALSEKLNGDERELALHCLLAGGDDYELCFTAPSQHRNELCQLSSQLNLALTEIGRIVVENVAEKKLLISDAPDLVTRYHAYDHFA